MTWPVRATHICCPPTASIPKCPATTRAWPPPAVSFLSKDYYAALRDALCRLALDYAPEHPAVLDTGCGEGYYTSAVYRAAGRREGPLHGGDGHLKAILRRAAKREKGRGVRRGLLLSPAGGGSVHRPAAQLLLPAGAGGISAGAPAQRHVSHVVPSEKHLWELKQVLYDHPYPNEVKGDPYEGFAYAEIRHVEDRIRVLGAGGYPRPVPDDPYYWKTPKSGCQRLAALEELAVTISFDIHVFSPGGVRLPKIFPVDGRRCSAQFL